MGHELTLHKTGFSDYFILKMTIILCCFALNETIIILRETELSNITNISKVVLLTTTAKM